MIAIIISEEDEASVNIGKELMKIAEWRREGDFYIHENMVMYHIPDMHLYHNNVDEEIRKEGYEIDAVVFASKHSSKSHIKSLTVHPIGNFGKALYGGKDEELVPSHPLLMKYALSLLHRKADGMEYQVSYEATHHGPYLKTPTFFIETGSTKEEWNNKRACRVIAEAILETGKNKDIMNDAEIAIGIGGGHYAPRFTDIAMKRNVAFGHIAAKYAVEFLSEKMLKKMVASTPGCSKAYYHGAFPELEEFLSKILGMNG
ncbi:MAG: D-aminoacyl-tRNA deacylase [Thermoplasmata archaeon]|nr:D-aminoacyl-tRNA deacylase [Thermoplasmata archaeon]